MSDPKPNRAFDFLLGAGIAAALNIMAVVLIVVVTGNETGEIPPVFTWLSAFGCVQAVWLLPLTIAGAVKRRLWFMVGVGVIALTGFGLSAVMLLLYGASQSTV